MGRPKGTNNVMRTVEEKEKILKDFYSEKIGRNEICRKYNMSTNTFKSWRIKYDKYGLKGLNSNTRKQKCGNKGLWLKKGKTLEEKLKLKIMKLDIENARLKKGYLVKGDGAQKEYVTTLDKNMK